MTEDIFKQLDLDEISDRRLDFRVKFDVPIEVEFDSAGRHLEKEKGHASQLSRRGLTLSSKSHIPIHSEILIRIFIPNSKYPIHSTAKVTWTSSANGTTMHGVEFMHIPRIHVPYLSRFLSQNMASRGHVEERRIKSQIISELIEFKNRRGKRIVGFHDHLLSVDHSAPFLIIPAAYGETKVNSLQIAYYLANNGFNVVRFDPSDHVGESEGEHLEYTMPKLKDDILSALDYVADKVPTAKIGIVAASLAARAAYKAVAEDSRASVLISLVGVVNTQYTLFKVQNEDLVGTYLNGKIWGITNVLGHDVRLQQFLIDCVDKGLHDLPSTLADLSKVKCPIVFLCGENDPWVNIEESRKAIDVLPADQREVHLISAMHKLKENPGEARRAFRTIVSSAFKYLKGEEKPPEMAEEPRAREIGVQGRLEKERAKHLSEFSKEEEKEFWESYLSRFHYIYSFPDYRELLETILEELGPLKKDDWVLDAGCGNGNFGLWLLIKLSEVFEKSKGKEKLVYNYVAGDIVQKALDHSRKQHIDAQLTLASRLGLARGFMVPQYLRLDMNEALPFIDNTFDKICSNLVISYLTNPVFSIKELIRVLKPGGKLVFTTLKKDADVSQIYRNFVEHASREVEVEEAKNLLSNAGKILQKETEGYFRFFSEREIQTLLNQASPGCVPVFRRCFANQAISVTLGK